MFGARKERERLIPWDRWQEEDTFFSFDSFFLLFVKENNSQTNERNIYKENGEIQDWGDYER